VHRASGPRPKARSFVDEHLERSDNPLRSHQRQAQAAGLPLALTLRFAAHAGAPTVCPLAGAVVDLWHCDRGRRLLPMVPRTRTPPPSAASFLRGYQVTDAKGRGRGS